MTAPRAQGEQSKGAENSAAGGRAAATNGALSKIVDLLLDIRAELIQMRLDRLDDMVIADVLVQRLGVSRRTIRAYTSRGLLKPYYVGSRAVYSWREVLADAKAGQLSTRLQSRVSTEKRSSRREEG